VWGLTPKLNFKPVRVTGKIMKFSRQNPSDLHPLRTYLYDGFGWRYRGKSVPPPGLHLLSATRMISSPSQLWRCDGHLSGEGFGGLQFDVHEVFARPAELPTAQSLAQMESEASGFEGLLIALRLKTSFLSRTIVQHDRGLLNPKAVDGMKRVGLGEPHFEDRFEVYSDDQVESRALLTLDFMERLLDMDQHPRYRNMQLGFIAGRMYVAIPSRDILRFGCDTTCIAPKQAAAKVIGEMETVFEVLGDIDVLQACAGRKCSDTIRVERETWYAERVADVEARVEQAMNAGILSGAPIPDWMTEDAYDLIDPRLHGLLSPRF